MCWKNQRLLFPVAEFRPCGRAGLEPLRLASVLLKHELPDLSFFRNSVSLIPVFAIIVAFLTSPFLLIFTSNGGWFVGQSLDVKLIVDPANTKSESSDYRAVLMNHVNPPGREVKQLRC